MKRSAEQVSRETQETLRRFAELLLRWNRSINLVSAADENAVWHRHIADALQLVALIEGTPERGIDLGSGAGFPGLILSLVTGMAFDLIEADQRKAAFLREAARITGAPVRIHPVRIEDANVPPAPLLTARALAPLPRLLCMAAPFVLPGGMCLFPKGKGVDAELTDARPKWHMRVERVASRIDPEGCILRIKDLVRRSAAN